VGGLTVTVSDCIDKNDRTNFLWKSVSRWTDLALPTLVFGPADVSADGSGEKEDCGGKGASDDPPHADTVSVASGGRVRVQLHLDASDAEDSFSNFRTWVFFRVEGAAGIGAWDFESGTITNEVGGMYDVVRQLFLGLSP
jgi:hypothetical protein